MTEKAALRIGPYTLPDRYDLPSRPATASPAVQDAHRQTNFLLSSDLALFERAMNLQLTILAASTKRRSPEAAALILFWSRTFSYLADACVLLGRASYGSCPPLLRAACDCIAAQRSLLAESFTDYMEWLAGAIGTDREHTGTHLELGRYRAGSALADDATLGGTYRFLTDLSMPHFGSGVLLTAPDSNQQRLALAFGDNTFHLGLAELVTGWLLLLAGAQTDTALESGKFEATAKLRDEAERQRRDIEQALANPRRCRAEELPDGRRIVHNFRRAVSGTPKRLIV